MVLLSLIDVAPGLLFWSLVSFLLLFFILKLFAWKPILAMIKERENSISEAIASADKVKKEMAEMKSENEKMIQQAREEKVAMLNEAKEIKDKIISEAKEQAKIEANKIMADSQVQINNQKLAALVEVKNEVGKLVLEVSEKVLRKQIDTGHQDYIDILTSEIKLN